MQGLREFPGVRDCGYCGFDPKVDEHHYCDGFGYSVVESTGAVLSSNCRDCSMGYCEHRRRLEGKPLVDFGPLRGRPRTHPIPARTTRPARPQRRGA